MRTNLLATRGAAIVATTCGLLLSMVALGGLVLVLSLVASVVIAMTVPVLWLTGKHHGALRLITSWAAYVVLYLTIATAITLAGAVKEPNLAVGEEACADSGCFAVDRVDRAAAAPGTSYTLYWHLSSTDKQLTKHFPGKGLELYLFDERGRTFGLRDNANPNPLDVTLPGGATVHDKMTFVVPTDVHQLFLTAEYRPFTFQSLLPGELSLVPHRPGRLIRIQ
jgi:hypothetical protein